MATSELAALLGLLLALSCHAPGCATTAAGPPDFAARVQQRLALANANETHTLRYNPTPCNCPTFEANIEGRWHRVAFDAPSDDELMVALEAASAAADAKERTFTLTGSFSTDLSTCAKGVVFVTLTPTGWLDRQE